MTGFNSKREAVADKLQKPDALTIAYQSGFYDGKKAALAQPAQEPSNGMPTSKAERQLRRMLCFQRHSHKAYMDDGEASFCGDEFHRSIDYMRESPDAIENAWHQAGLKRLKAKPPLPMQEPVAWVWKDMRGQDIVSLFEPRFNSVPLYTKPPQREWVGLTEKEAKSFINFYKMDIARLVEAKLKQKNGY
jgi:hypothetical protein